MCSFEQQLNNLFEKWLKMQDRIGGLVVHPYSRQAAMIAKETFRDIADNADWPDKRAKKCFNRLYEAAYYDSKLAKEHWTYSIFDDPKPELTVIQAVIIASGIGTEQMDELLKRTPFLLRGDNCAERLFKEYVYYNETYGNDEYTIDDYNNHLLNSKAIDFLCDRLRNANVLASLQEDKRENALNILKYYFFQKYKLKDNSQPPQKASISLLPKCLRGQHPIRILIKDYLSLHQIDKTVGDIYREAGIDDKLHTNLISIQRPSRESLYSIIMTLKMSEKDAEDFIAKASGYRIRHFSFADFLFKYFLNKKHYKLKDYNYALKNSIKLLTKNVFVQSSRNLNSFRSQAETTVIEKLPMLEGENRQEEIEKTAKMLFIKEKLKNMQLGEPLDHIKF